MSLLFTRLCLGLGVTHKGLEVILPDQTQPAPGNESPDHPVTAGLAKQLNPGSRVSRQEAPRRSFGLQSGKEGPMLQKPRPCAFHNPQPPLTLQGFPGCSASAGSALASAKRAGGLQGSTGPSQAASRDEEAR